MIDQSSANGFRYHLLDFTWLASRTIIIAIAVTISIADTELVSKEFMQLYLQL
jgi:hypothetical protein